MPLDRRRGGSQMMMRYQSLVGYVESLGATIFFDGNYVGDNGGASRLKNRVYRTLPGPELLANNQAPFAFDGDDPTGWTVTGEVTTDPEISEVGTGQGHNGAGTGYVNLYSTSADVRMYQDVLTKGPTFQIEADVDTRVSGSYGFMTDGGAFVGSSNTGTKQHDWIATGTLIGVKRFLTTADLTFSRVSAKKISERDGAIQNAAVSGGGVVFTPAASKAVVVTPVAGDVMRQPTTFKIAFQATQSGAGENSRGVFFTWGNATQWLRMSTSNRLVGFVDMTGTDAICTTNIGQVADTEDVKSWFAMDFDGVNIRLFKVVNGTASQLTLASSTSGTGVIANQPTNAFYIGNRSVLDGAFDGTIYRLVYAPNPANLWTLAELEHLETLAAAA